MVQQNKHLFYFYIDITAGYNIFDNHFNLIKTVKQEKNSAQSKAIKALKFKKNEIFNILVRIIICNSMI